LSILSKYKASKDYNFNLDLKPEKVSKTANASTYVSKKIETWPDGKKEIVGAQSDSYYKEITKTKEEVVDGKTFLVTYNYSEIAIAKTIIHESIHAKIGTTFKEDDDHHNMYNTYRALLVAALTEYVKDNKLNYTQEQIEQFSWAGIQASDSFSKYLTELASKNNTTVDDERKKWTKAYSEMNWTEVKREEKSEVPTTGTN